jgi:hypothetical protein
LTEAVDNDFLSNEIVSAASVQGGRVAEVFASLAVDKNAFVPPTAADVREDITLEGYGYEDDDEITIIGPAPSLFLTASTLTALIVSVLAFGVILN